MGGRTRRVSRPSGKEPLKGSKNPKDPGFDSSIIKLSRDSSIWHAVYQIAPVNEGSRFVALKGLSQADAQPLEELVRGHMNGLFEPKQRVELLDGQQNPDFAGYLLARAGREDEKSDRLFMTLAYLENYREVLNNPDLPQPTGRTAYLIGAPTTFAESLRTGLVQHFSENLDRFVKLYEQVFPTLATRTGKLKIDPAWRQKMWLIPNVPERTAQKRDESWGGAEREMDAKITNQDVSPLTLLTSIIPEVVHATRTIREFPGFPDGDHRSTIKVVGPRDKETEQELTLLLLHGDIKTEQKIVATHPFLEHEILSGTHRAERYDLNFTHFYAGMREEEKLARIGKGFPFVTTTPDGRHILIGYTCNDLGPTKRADERTLYLATLDKTIITPTQIARILRAIDKEPTIALRSFETKFPELRTNEHPFQLDPDFRVLRFLDPPEDNMHWWRRHYTVEEFIRTNLPGQEIPTSLEGLENGALARHLAQTTLLGHALLGNFPERFEDKPKHRYAALRWHNVTEEQDGFTIKGAQHGRFPQLFTPEEAQEQSGTQSYRVRLKLFNTTVGYALFTTWLDEKAKLTIAKDRITGEETAYRKETSYVAFIDDTIAREIYKRAKRKRKEGEPHFALQLIDNVYPWADRSKGTLSLDDHFAHEFEEPKPASERTPTGRLAPPPAETARKTDESTQFVYYLTHLDEPLNSITMNAGTTERQLETRAVMQSSEETKRLLALRTAFMKTDHKGMLGSLRIHITPRDLGRIRSYVVQFPHDKKLWEQYNNIFEEAMKTYDLIAKGQPKLEDAFDAMDPTSLAERLTYEQFKQTQQYSTQAARIRENDRKREELMTENAHLKEALDMSLADYRTLISQLKRKLGKTEEQA